MTTVGRLSSTNASWTPIVTLPFRACSKLRVMQSAFTRGYINKLFLSRDSTTHHISMFHKSSSKLCKLTVPMVAPPRTQWRKFSTLAGQGRTPPCTTNNICTPIMLSIHREANPLKRVGTRTVIQAYRDLRGRSLTMVKGFTLRG